MFNELETGPHESPLGVGNRYRKTQNGYFAVLSLTMTYGRAVSSCLCLLLWLAPTVVSKKVSGSFRLNGADTEYSLTSFALSSFARGWMDLILTTKEMYVNEQSLALHLYIDTDWSRVRKAPTCKEKTQLAKRTVNVRFDYIQSTDSYKATLGVPLNQENEDRTHYWYMLIDDCSLEYFNHDDSVPKVHFELQAWNDVGGKAKSNTGGSKSVELTHLPADEVSMSKLHIITMVVSLLIAVGMGLRILQLLYRTQSVHAALCLVALAAVCDAASSFCELVHLRWYRSNGIGWYLFDAMASHYEAICDSIVAILLLSIASGWTLPSDVVKVPSIQSTFLQSTVQGLRNPAGAVASFNKAGVLAVAIVATHAVLAQWGRTYDDEFDTYHDLEHPPGRVLMIFRITLGILMVAAAVQTKSSCPQSLQGFYTQLAIVGTLWFQSLPLVTWVSSWAVPYYLRHPTVSTWGAIVQTTSLLLLVWLVSGTSNSYHKVSRLQSKGNDFTDQLHSTNGNDAPSVWRMGKAKIRLD